MKQSPFSDGKMFARVLLKAVLLVAAVNVALIVTGFNPVQVLIRANIWDVIGGGRARLAYPSDFQNGQLPLEALLASHQISAGPKPENEYRVVFLGESGIAGWGVSDEDTLADQLTERGIIRDARPVVAYNLAYPQPSAARDALILDAAMAYHPDLVIWFLTPAALDNGPDIIGTNRVFFDLNQSRMTTLVDTYPDLLQAWYQQHQSDLTNPKPAWMRFSGIRDQVLLPIWMNAQFYVLIPPDLGESDRRMGSESIPTEARYTSDAPGFTRIPNETWNFIQVVCLRAQAEGSDLLLINEPMLVGSGANSEVNYNANYARDFYDRYRDTLAQVASDHGIRYADLWNLIPASHFTDTPLHSDAGGYAILSAALEEFLTGSQWGSTCHTEILD